MMEGNRSQMIKGCDKNNRCKFHLKIIVIHLRFHLVESYNNKSIKAWFNKISHRTTQIIRIVET